MDMGADNKQVFDLDALAAMDDSDFIGVDMSSFDEPQEQEAPEQQEQEQEEQEEVNIPDGSKETDSNNQEFEEEEQEPEEQEEGEEEETEGVPDEVSELNANPQELLDKLFQPFAANGTQIKVDSVEEAIELMKMGANYHKKMHMIKPHMRFIRALEGKGLLTEDRVNFAIDLLSGDKNALAKLMADGNINPLNVDTDDSVNYSPVKHVESEQTSNLNDVLAEVQDSPHFQETMDVATRWDDSSKEKLVAEPNRIKTLMAHKANGLFDRINTEVARMKMFGQLPANVSDIDAYEMVGMKLMQSEAPSQSPAKVDVPPTQKPNNDLKKRIASPTKQNPKKKQQQFGDIDELAKLSDEEFLKVSSKYF